MQQFTQINISETLTHIIYEIIKQCPEFYHIDMNHVTICVSSNRKGSRGGIYGKLVPLRFKDGSTVTEHRGAFFRMPEVSIRGNSMLYLIYFYMPRFFDLPIKEKINVIFHELYHISPDFNGDIRRMAAVKAIHGHSKEAYDAQFEDSMKAFAEYIEQTPYRNFLELNSRDMYRIFKKVTATRMKLPRPYRVNKKDLAN